MKRLFTLISSLLVAAFILPTTMQAQVAGDYRSAAVGPADWGTAASWERYDGAMWVAPAPAAPTNTDGVITIQSGHTINVAASVTADQIIVDAMGTVTVASGITLTIANGADAFDCDVTGTIQNNAGTITTTGALRFNSGGTYKHNHTTTSGTIPTATWNAASNVEIIGYTTFASAVGGFTTTQTFGNVTWNCPSQTSALNMNLSGTYNIAGTLTFTSTGSGSVRFAGSTHTLNLGGFAMAAGTLDLSGSSTSSTIKVAGTFNQTGGTVTESGTSTGTVIEFNGSSLQNVTLGTVTNSINYTITNNAGINLTGTMTVAAGTTLTVTSTAAEPIANASSGSVSYTGNTAAAANNSTLLLTNTNAVTNITDKMWPAVNPPNAVRVTNTNTGSATPTHKAILATTGSRTLNATASQTVLTLTQSVLDIANNDLIIGKNGTVTGGAIAFVITSGTGFYKFYMNSAAFTNFTFNVGYEAGGGTREYSECYLVYTAAFSATTFVGIRAVNTIIPGDVGGTDHVKRHWTFKQETDDGAATPAPTGTGFAGTGTYKIDLKGPQTTDLVGSIGNVRLFRYDGTSYFQINSGTASGTNYTVGTFTGTFPAMNVAVNKLDGMSYSGRTYLGAQTYTWNGSVDADYQVAANWTPSRTATDLGDNLIFNASTVSLTNIPAETIGKLTLSGNAQVTLNTPTNALLLGGGTATGTVNVLNIGDGSKLTVGNTGGFSISGPSTATTRTATIDGTLETASSGAVTISSSNTTTVTFSATGIFNYLNTATAAITNSAGAAFLQFASGANYNHLRAGGGSFPTGTFNSGSNVTFGSAGTPMTSFLGLFAPSTSFAANVTVHMNLASAGTISLTNGSNFSGNWNLNTYGTGKLRLSGAASGSYTWTGQVSMTCSNVASGLELSTAITSGTTPTYTFGNASTTAPSLTVTGGTLNQQATTGTTLAFTTVNISNGLTIGNSGSIVGNTNTGALLSGDFQININKGDVTFGTGTTMAGINPTTASTSTAKTQISFLSATGDQNFTPPATFTGRNNVLVNKTTSGNVILSTRNLTLNTLSLTKGCLVLGNNNLTVAYVGVTAATSTSGIISASGLSGNWVVTDGTGTVTMNITTNYIGSRNTIPVGASLTSFDPVAFVPTTAGNFTASVKATFTNIERDPSLSLDREWNIVTSSSTPIEFKPATAAGTAPVAPYVGKYSGGAWVETVSAGVGTGPNFPYSLNSQTTGLFGIGSQYAFTPLSISSAATGNWSAPATWSPAAVPTAQDNMTTINHDITADVSPTVKNLTLTAGKVTLGSNDLTVTTALSGGSNTSYVITNGSGKLTIPTTAGATKLFPIGFSASSYDPFTIKPTNSVSVGARVDDVFDNAILVPADAAPREWNLTATGQGVCDLTFTPSIAAPNGAPTLPVIGHHTGSIWQEYSNNAYTSYSGGTWTILGYPGTFSPFGVGQQGAFGSVVLAVDFTALSATNKGITNLVTFTTANEKDLTAFQIERSATGTEWSSIGEVKAKGASTYTFVDANPLPISYYRVRGVELSGKSIVSKIVSVNTGKAKLTVLNVYPSQTKNNVTIDFDAVANSNVTVSIKDITGRLVLTKNVKGTEGVNNLTLDVSNLSSGLYIMSINDNVSSIVKRIVKN